MPHLRVIIEQCEPWAHIQYRNGQIHLQGPFQAMLDSVSSVVGFSYTIVQSVDGKWGGPSGSGYNGMVGMLHRNEADFALGPFTETEERYPAIHYTNPILVDVHAILSPYSNAQQYDFRVFNILTLESWLAVMGTFVIFNCVAAVMSHVLHLGYPDYLAPHLFFASLLGRSLPSLPNQKNSRMIYGLWLIFCTLLYNCFVCQIKSSMVSENSRNIDSLDDLLQSNTIIPLLESGGALEHKIMKSTDPVLSSLRERIQSRNPPAVSSVELRTNEIMEDVQNGRYAAIAERFTLNSMLANRTYFVQRCSYYVSGGFIENVVLAMAISKSLNSSLIAAIDNWSARLMESGLHRHYQHRIQAQADSCLTLSSKIPSITRINVKSMMTPFELWFLGTIVSVVALMAEHVVYARCRKVALQNESKLQKNQRIFKQRNRRLTNHDIKTLPAVIDQINIL